MSATTIIVNDESPRRQYTATAGQTVFDFPIPFFEQGDLTVYLTPSGQTADDAVDLLVITTNYTISGENTQDGGLVTLTSGASAGDILTVERVLDLKRLADYQNAGDLLAETLNREQDSEIMISQQLRDSIDSSIRRKRSSTSTGDLTFEPEANTVLSFDTAGNIVLLDKALAGTVPVVYTESVTLTDGQTSVTFSNSADRASMYITGDLADNGQILKNTDYAVDVTAKIVTLTQSYPAGTVLTLAYNAVGDPVAPAGDQTFDTVALLKNASLSTGVTVKTRGYTTAGDGGGATYLIVASQAADGFGDHVLANGNVAVIQEAIILVERFGATSDGVDSTTALDAAIAYAGSFDHEKTVYFKGGRYRWDSNVSVNPQRVSFAGLNATALDFGNMPASTTAIWFRGVGTAGESVIGNRARVALHKIRLIGHSTAKLVEMSSDSGTQDSRGLIFRDVLFDTFLTGINLAENGWGLSLDHYGFTGGVAGSVHINEESDASNTNFGEMNSFSRGMHSGTGTAYKSQNFSSDAHFSQVSFDCEKAIDISRGAKVSIQQFHIESGTDTTDMFSVDGDVSGLAQTTLNMKDGTLQIIGASRTNDFFACAKNFSVGNGGIYIDGLTIVGGTGAFSWTNKSLVGGTGPVKMTNYSYQFLAPAITIADAMNEINNGGFETGNLGDWTPVDAGNAPTASVTSPRSGTYCLEMPTIGGAFVGVTISKPVKAMQKVFFGCFRKLEAVVQGGAGFNKLLIGYKILDVLGNVLKTEELTFDGTVGYTYTSFTTLDNAPMPKGAESILITLSMQAAASGTSRIDDVVLNIID